jgi:hypothetical protein
MCIATIANIPLKSIFEYGTVEIFANIIKLFTIQTHNENGYFGIVLELTSMYLCFDVVALLAPSNKVVGKHSWSRGSIAGIEPISLRAGWPGA